MERVLFAVDGSVPPGEAAEVAQRLLPREAEVQVLEVVHQLPYAWTAWPAFPDAAQDLREAEAYVAEVSRALKAHGRVVECQVDFSPLGAAEMDQEILRVAETLRPGLICLALERDSVIGSIVHRSAVPVLVAKCAASEDRTAGRKRSRVLVFEPALLDRPVLLNAVGALVFRRAGIL